MDIVKINNLIFNKIIDSQEIKLRVAELALEIRETLDNDNLIYMVILKGAFIFAADLIRDIGVAGRIVFVDAKSYGSKMQSSGNVSIIISEKDLKDKNVLIIEDIIDSGYTMDKMKKHLLTLTPSSLKIVTLLSKPSERKVPIFIDFIGFELPSDFVVGYGLDYDEQGRELKHIYAQNNLMNQHVDLK